MFLRRWINALSQALERWLFPSYYGERVDATQWHAFSWGFWGGIAALVEYVLFSHDTGQSVALGLTAIGAAVDGVIYGIRSLRSIYGSKAKWGRVAFIFAVLAVSYLLGAAVGLFLGAVIVAVLIALFLMRMIFRHGRDFTNRW